MLSVKLGVFSCAFLCCFLLCSSLRCLESVCHKFADGSSFQCTEKQRYCSPYAGQERCMTIRAKMVVSNREVFQEIRNCTPIAMCSIPRIVCTYGNISGNYKECDLSCCHGDLCNNKSDVSMDTSKPTNPIGSDLICFSCVSTARGINSFANCSQSLTKQRCGLSGTTGLIQDRCMRIKVKSGLVTQEFRNCSDAVYCSGDNYCRSANRTASWTLDSCDVSCCYGNLCNNDVKLGKKKTEYRSTVKPSKESLIVTTDRTTVREGRDLHVTSRGVSLISDYKHRFFIIVLLYIFNVVSM